jgi:DNA-binding LacI/PurR family transcriptional regulator
MPTIRDVAKAAGVSHTTVSLVMNGDPRVSAATRAKVQAMIVALDFVPDATARKLASGRTGVLAVVIPNLGSAFAVHALRGIEAGLVGSGLDLQIHSGQDLHPEGSLKSRRTVVAERIFASRKADAVILVTGHTGEAVRREGAAAKIPLIALEESDAYDHAVLFDNVAAGKLGMEHLLGQGRKRIAVVIGDARHMTTQTARLKGIRQALAARRKKLDEQDVYPVYLHHMDEGRQLWDRLRSVRPAYDAAFCAAGDLVAMGLMAGAGDQGIALPQELALLGMDDQEAAAAVGLSTIEQPIRAMGRRASELALDAMAGKLKQPVVELFKPRLILRRTA